MEPLKEAKKAWGPLKRLPYRNAANLKPQTKPYALSRISSAWHPPKPKVLNPKPFIPRPHHPSCSPNIGEPMLQGLGLGFGGFRVQGLGYTGQGLGFRG